MVLGDTKTRAKLQLTTYTGLPHTQLAQVKPEHVDLTIALTVQAHQVFGL